MFSISKNDVSKRFPLRRGIRGRMFPSDYGIIFSICSFFPLPSIHLVILMESRELGATRDLELQRSSFSFCFSLLLLASNLVFRLMSYVFFSILLSSLFGIAPKSKTTDRRELTNTYEGEQE